MPVTATQFTSSDLDISITESEPGYYNIQVDGQRINGMDGEDIMVLADVIDKMLAVEKP